MPVKIDKDAKETSFLSLAVVVTDEGSKKKYINNKVSENYMQIPEQESQAPIPFLN